ncbi:MAG: lipopolysaccharide kinase InaA family protein [Thalassospira sp.]|uniref:lipopolysaccharide kinase InaA family protein n=1 Tax=Thalassospira sp. TaxID=1912094 RepID=UPI0032ECE054
MNEQLHLLVEHTIAQGVGARVFALRWENRRIWVKQAVPAKHKVWHRLQRFFANITGIALLRPTVSAGGQAGLESEANTLRKLASQGVLVPDIVDIGQNWLAIGDNGGILQTRIEDDMFANNLEAVKDHISSAGAALAELHHAGMAHGAPLLRNMTLRDDGKIGFIDFEEDPNARMPMIDAQARDILLFVFSIQREFKKRPEFLRLGWHAYMRAAGADAPQLVPLRKVFGLLRPVYLILSPFRRWLGTDAINGLGAYRILRKTLREEAIQP